ncbi:MAG TPA: DUF4430 domain-containing protein [Firmicutes bacterium]|nr:DUF4430 domain-containing protein [Bacillota bacterium]
MKRMKRYVFGIALLVGASLFSGCSSQQEAPEAVCTIGVSCETLLGKEEALPEEKRELVPEDGWLLPKEEITFTEGETAFEALQEALKEAEIPMEFEEMPAYDTVYIEGIGNLYEQDGGPESGWMYLVNGDFPDTGADGYQLQEGDEVIWVYSLEMGADIETTPAAQ